MATSRSQTADEDSETGDDAQKKPKKEHPSSSVEPPPYDETTD